MLSLDVMVTLTEVCILISLLFSGYIQYILFEYEGNNTNTHTKKNVKHTFKLLMFTLKTNSPTTTLP